MRNRRPRPTVRPLCKQCGAHVAKKKYGKSAGLFYEKCGGCLYPDKMRRLAASESYGTGKYPRPFRRHSEGLWVDVAQLLTEQDGRCAICNKKFTRTPHRDHCHKAFKPRGLLCGNCNRFLGLAQDDLAILERAIEYLKRHSS